MNTKIGKVSTIQDFFTLSETIVNKPGTGGFGSTVEEVWECKLCGEKMRGVSPKGACHSMMDFIRPIAERHIELHKTTIALGIEI